MYLDAQTAGFANFSALDIFVNRSFYHTNTAVCEAFVGAIKEAITFITDHPECAMCEYYAYTSTESSPLMDDILRATIACFDAGFRSDYVKELPILEFFTEIGITELSPGTFKTAFLN